MDQAEQIARTIAGLYNGARVQGLGFLQAVPGKMPLEEAAALASLVVRDGSLRFDYLRGRVMKVRVTTVSPFVTDLRLYDRDNGPGAGQRAIEDGLTDPFYKDLAAA